MADVPAGMVAVASFERHEDAGLPYARLIAAGIDARVIDTAPDEIKWTPWWVQMIPHPVGTMTRFPLERVTGPYLLVVPGERAVEAQGVLTAMGTGPAT